MPQRMRPESHKSHSALHHLSAFCRGLLLRSLAACAMLLFPFSEETLAAEATGKRGMVATVSPLATEAGLQAMREGGNAVDAAVAAALMLGVVDGHNSGIGGGCFILIRRADGKLVAIDGRETAPARSTRDMYVKDGKAQTELSQTGALASGTPGALAAYALAVAEFGQRPLKELLLPAAQVAEQGFILDEGYASRLKANAAELAQFPGSRAVFLKADGTPYAAGEVLRQPDLARSYLALAEQGPDWFYRGSFAKQVSQWMSENGGILSTQDFANYKPVLREPLVTTYRGHWIIGFPPPSSGGVHVAQILNLLEPFDLAKLYAEDQAAFTHVLTESMKLAFADRAFWLGDPAFAQVPRGLIDKQYAAQLGAKIDLLQATPVPRQGDPPRSRADFFERHTTHIAAADEAGNWVALTTTINTTFGSKVIVPGTGVLLNNQMDDFSAQPGVPNAFGLVGAEANAIAPGKRPLSSMSPTIVLKSGQPVLTVGAAGGPKIITQVVQALVRTIDLRQSLEEAVASPRVHHQWRPDEVQMEKTVSSAVQQALQKLGHKLQAAEAVGVTQAISRDAEGTFHGVADPRVNGKAAGY